MRKISLLLLLCLCKIWASTSSLSCPIKESVFFSFDINDERNDCLEKNNLMNTSQSAEHYDISSTIESCFDESNIGKAAWMMTSDGDTKLKITLTYLDNDPKYVITAQSVKFYFYEGDDFFNDNAKEPISDTDLYVGEYTTETTDKSASVSITAPKKFPYTDKPYYSYYVVIKVKFKNGGTASIAKNIGISRPGVIFLHGLNSSSETFNKMKDFLISSSAYIDPQILTHDYRATNTSSFYDNTHKYQVVKKGLETLSDNLFEIGIASTKYDMVGHSMGGILERLYNQEVDNNHTNKLITLNTPHFGAPLGNIAPILFNNIDNLPPNFKWLSSAVNKLFNPNDGRMAVSDLAIGSNAIDNLNSNSTAKLSGIPVFAVGTYLDIDTFKPDVIEAINITEDLTFLLAHIFYDEIPQNRYTYLLGDVWGDGVVSINSQQGGLPSQYYNMIKGPILFANHCSSPNWINPQNKIKQLLLSAPDENVFSMSGFGTDPSSNSRSINTYSSSNFNTTFSSPNANSYIKLKAYFPKKDEDIVATQISHSEDMLTTMVFSIISETEMISDYDSKESKFRVPSDIDSLTIYSIGRTNYNALILDSVVVKRNDDSGIESIDINKSRFSYFIKDNNIVIDSNLNKYAIEIYNTLGHCVRRYDKTESNTYPLDNLTGILFIKIVSDEKFKTFKLII